MSIHDLPRCLNNVSRWFDTRVAYLSIKDLRPVGQRVLLLFKFDTLRSHPDERPLEKLVYATFEGPDYNYVLEKNIVEIHASSQLHPRELGIWSGASSASYVPLVVSIPMCQELANALLDIQDYVDQL